MTRFLLYIFGLVGIFLSPISIEQARQFRNDPYLQPAEDEERRQHILEDFCASLPVYSDVDFTEMISSFARDTLGENFLIVDSASTFLKGKSSDKVFLLYDHHTKHLKYVVKAFRNPRTLSSKFLPEISALNLLMELQLPHVMPVETKATALVNCKGEEYGLLLESAAKGKRIDQYIYLIANFDIGSLEREIQLQAAENAFWRMGESLASLHSFRSEELVPLPANLVSKMEAKIKEAFANPLITSALFNYVDLENLQDYLNQVIREASFVKIYLTYQHGDSHLGNMFYDAMDDALYFIDNALLHKSIDIRGNPTLDGSSDLLRADEHFRRKAFGFLEDTEIDRLIAIYYSGYCSISNGLPDSRLITFYRNYLKLGRLIKYSNYMQEPDMEKRMRDEAIFTQVLEYFAEQCYSLSSKEE